MDTLNNCLTELGLINRMRKKPHPTADKHLANCPQTISIWINRSCEEKADIGNPYMWSDPTSREKILEDTSKIEILCLCMWMNEIGSEDYEWEDEDTGEYKKGVILNIYNDIIKPVIDKYYPPKKSLKSNSGSNIVEYDMRIKEAHFQHVYDKLYENIDSEYLCSNKYKHRCDLKKKFLKNDLYRDNGGKKSVDHQLVLFNRLFQLEMERINQ